MRKLDTEKNSTYFALLIVVNCLLFFTIDVESSEAMTGLKKQTPEELINQLTEVSELGVGYHPTAWASAFIAVEDTAECNGGIIGSIEPKVNPFMRELVRRGVESLPFLIAHLSDSRPTKMTVGTEPDGFFMAMSHSNEYEPRYSEPRYSIHTDRTVNEYTLRVGDLCYVAIGQIVNRELNVLRYQPSLCLVINSPVETPELVELVKNDWADLTIDEHKKSLMHDFQSDRNSYRAHEALKRLKFYYNLTECEIYWKHYLTLLVILTMISLGLFIYVLSLLKKTYPQQKEKI